MYNLLTYISPALRPSLPAHQQIDSNCLFFCIWAVLPPPSCPILLTVNIKIIITLCPNNLSVTCTGLGGRNGGGRKILPSLTRSILNYYYPQHGAWNVSSFTRQATDPTVNILDPVVDLRSIGLPRRHWLANFIILLINISCRIESRTIIHFRKWQTMSTGPLIISHADCSEWFVDGTGDSI